MKLFKYFQEVEHAFSESAQAIGLKDVEQNQVQKQKIIIHVLYWCIPLDHEIYTKCKKNI